MVGKVLFRGMTWPAASIVFTSSIHTLVGRWDNYLNEFG